MSTILLCWELGSGMAHFMNLRPLAEELSKRGHKIVAVLRDLSPARRIFADPRIRLLQAPFRHDRLSEIEPACTFAHLLHNVGFGNLEELRALSEAWRQLFDFVKPDLTVFDHSPTALLASRGIGSSTVLIGGGFFCPPDVSPLPNLRTWIAIDGTKLIADEARVLSNVNSVLREWREEPLDYLAQLYHPVSENLLLGFREFDCYPERSNCRYWGLLPATGGQAPQWPGGNGAKIFAYIKAFPALPQLLGILGKLPNPIIFVTDGIPAAQRKRFQRPNLRFVDGLVDIKQVARQCDFAILNGSFGTTIELLLAGKPIVQIPIVLEQGLNSRVTELLGAGIYCRAAAPAEIAYGLQTMLSEDRFVESAKVFASRHADFDAFGQASRMADQLESIAVRA